VVAAALAAGVKASFLVERHEERQRTGVAQVGLALAVRNQPPHRFCFAQVSCV